MSEKKKYERQNDLEILARVVAKVWYYGNWKWENPNERLLEYQMRKLGLYPFRNEDEMIKETKVDEKYYTEARENVKFKEKKNE